MCARREAGRPRVAGSCSCSSYSGGPRAPLSAVPCLLLYSESSYSTHTHTCPYLRESASACSTWYHSVTPGWCHHSVT